MHAYQPGRIEPGRIVFISQGNFSKEEIFDSAAEKQFVLGLIAMKIFVHTERDGILVPTKSSSDSVQDIILARSHFIEAIRLTFQTLDSIQQETLPGVTNWGRAECCIQSDLMEYMYHLAQIFHRPRPILKKQNAACPATAELLYEIVAQMGYKHAFREISWMHSDGCFGSSKDQKFLAAYWLRKAHSEDMDSSDVGFGECWVWKHKYDSYGEKQKSIGKIQPNLWLKPFSMVGNCVSFVVNRYFHVRNLL